MPETRPKSGRLRVGRGSNAGGQGYYDIFYVRRQGLFIGWAGTVNAEKLLFQPILPHPKFRVTNHRTFPFLAAEYGHSLL